MKVTFVLGFIVFKSGQFKHQVKIDILFSMKKDRGLWRFCVGLCLSMLYFMSFCFSISLTRKRNLAAMLLLSLGCRVTVNVL